MVQRLGHYAGMSKNDVWIWRRMQRVKWTDKIKKNSCARKSGRMKNNSGTEKEEETKLAGPLAKKGLSAEGYSKRYGKWEESSRQEKISDDRQHYDKWTV